MFRLPISLVDQISKLNVTAMIDIVLVAILVYQFISIVRGRRSAHILAGIGVMLLVYVLAAALGLELLRSILAALAPYTAFALIVLFQAEIRRVLARLGRRRWISFGGRVQGREIIDEILLATKQLSDKKTGALIVLEKDIGLRTFVESGVALDAILSSELLTAIFERNAPLHDGAVIVQGERITAAACFLPLSINPAVAHSLGTRHRAGIGVTEETDCLSIIVSEETGHVSIAKSSEIEMDVTPERLDERVSRHFGQRVRARSEQNAELPVAGVKQDAALPPVTE